MKVQGMIKPELFTVERIPGTNRSLVRLYQNVTTVKKENFEGFEYDEYHVEVETWDDIAQNVQDNYEVFLQKGMDNERNRDEEIDTALRDADEMNVDQEYRLTMLELSLTE